VRIVDEWLVFHGVSPTNASTQRSKAGDWITIPITVKQAERMLGAKYNAYEHAQSGDQVVRTLRYSLPQELHSHIDVIAPTTYFGTMKSMKATSFLQPEIKPQSLKEGASVDGLPAQCGTIVTPACIRALYNTAGYTPTATSTNKLGVAGYLSQYANYADLQVSGLGIVRMQI